MSECEIVSNTACGKDFWVCRTHKVEVSEATSCPGNAKSPTREELVDKLQHLVEKKMIKHIESHYGPDALKREFKVGDNVRCLQTYSMGFGGTMFTAGKIYRVRAIKGMVLLIELDDRGDTTNGWGKHFFELVSE